MLILIALVAATLFLAYANGANDNFKGVATLYGSHSASYRTALGLGTIATFLGGICSLFLATGLIKAFSGSGVVPAAVAASPEFLLAVATGAAGAVFLATRVGLPISTTHALIGGILGAGAIATAANLNLAVLGRSFAAPLLLSPVLSVGLTVVLYGAAHRLGQRFKLTRETCVCLDGGDLVPLSTLEPVGGEGCAAPTYRTAAGGLVVADAQVCVEKYGGRFFGLRLQRVIDAGHFTTAAAVSFARGLNDTPKMVGLLLVVRAIEVPLGVVAVAVVMAVGGLLNARKVAQTMGRKISRMNDGQAFTANLVTAVLVISASRLGLPVSTTHVSVGAIAGVGLVNRTANRQVISGILASWLLTIPVGAALAGLVYVVASRFG
ncbi:MAG: inorganic phosphate transporter family protein [Proteobacteria bacterium]|nr:inorganic phosphate transporter family protein [Pseudomonadota bacterium]MBW3618049.1 inorganic phosphate transporter family protein [Pseudomonadota bacterium]